MYFCGTQINYTHWGMTQEQIIDKVIERSQSRQMFYELLLKLFAICCRKGLRLVVENPWSVLHYLHNNFPFKPKYIDKNRWLHGDFFKKPTQYFFLNCEPTNYETIQNDKPQKTIRNITGRSDNSGLCSEERSMISPDYARNFICDKIIGKPQKHTQLTLFDDEKN